MIYLTIIYFFPVCSLKLHHEKRPLSMKTDIIKKRQRYESTNTSPQQSQASANPNKKATKKSKGDNSISNVTTTATSTTQPNSPELSPTLMALDNSTFMTNNPDQLFTRSSLGYPDFNQQVFAVYQQQQQQQQQNQQTQLSPPLFDPNNPNNPNNPTNTNFY